MFPTYEEQSLYERESVQVTIAGCSVKAEDVGRALGKGEAHCYDWS